MNSGTESVSSPTCDTFADEMRHCSLCPRQCGVDRIGGARGVCGAGAALKLFRWGAHHGEEPPISGTRGSGAVFFSHCPLGCIYCQNHPWTAGGAGEETSVARLSAILLDLAAQGCHNWNLVTPEPWLPAISEAVRTARAAGAALPCVFNTSGYALPRTCARFRDLLDIALVDLRYSGAKCAAEASHAADYPERAREFARWCWNEIGPLRTDSNGIATGGTILRILVLPGHEDEAVENLRWTRKTLGRNVHISLMSQYTPAHKALDRAPWNRTISENEFRRVTDEAERLGLEEGWTQPWGTATGDDELMGANMAPGPGTVG